MVRIYRKPGQVHWKVFVESHKELIEFVADRYYRLISPAKSMYSPRNERDYNPHGCDFILVDSGSPGRTELADVYVGRCPEVLDPGYRPCTEEIPHEFCKHKDYKIVE